MAINDILSSRNDETYVTYNALTVSMRDGKGNLVPVKEVQPPEEGTSHRENWNHLAKYMGALMWESAVEAGFDKPLTPSANGTAEFFSEIATFMEANADKSYVLDFDGLELHYTALEEAVDSGARIIDAHVDTAKAAGDAWLGMFGMPNPMGEAWAETMKSGTKAQHKIAKQTISLPLGNNIDLSTAAQHMADLIAMVNGRENSATR